MPVIQLKSRYTGVCYRGVESYGGNQRSSIDPVIKKCGCGIIAALDTLLYLGRQCRWTDVPELGPLDGDSPISAGKYEESIAAMKRAYFPVLYPLGTNGMALALGINRFFKRYCLPFHGTWRPATAGIWTDMELMLSSDIPIVCAVGAIFPKFWERNGLTLQTFRSEECMAGTASARAHFVTVTGLDEEWIQISSWGKKYYISRKDYLSYVKEKSNPLLCGILYIRRK